MSRIRTVKPGFFTHPKIQSVSVPARLLLIALWTDADDEGRLYDQPKRLATTAFGEDALDTEPLLTELAGAYLIHRYIFGERRLIQVHDFTDHQRINRSTPSSLPAFEGSVIPHGVPTPGREGKGREEILPDVVGADWEEPRPARGLTQMQDSLFADLKTMPKSNWDRLAYSGVNKLNGRWGKDIVLLMFQRAREEKANPVEPFPWCNVICSTISATRKVSA